MRKKIVSIINKCIYAAILLLAASAVFCYFYSNMLAAEAEKEYIEYLALGDFLDYVRIEKPWYSVNKEDFIFYYKWKIFPEDEEVSFYKDGEFCSPGGKFISTLSTMEVDGETVARVIEVEEGVLCAEVVKDVDIDYRSGKKSYKKYDKISVYYEHARHEEREIDSVDTVRRSDICAFTGDDILEIKGKKIYVSEIQLSGFAFMLFGQ